MVTINAIVSVFVNSIGGIDFLNALFSFVFLFGMAGVFYKISVS